MAPIYNNTESPWHGRANGKRIEEVLKKFPEYDKVAKRVVEIFTPLATMDDAENTYRIMEAYVQAISEIGTLIVVAHQEDKEDHSNRTYWNWITSLTGSTRRNCSNCKQNAIICCGCDGGHYCFWCCPDKKDHEREWENEKSQNSLKTF